MGLLILDVPLSPLPTPIWPSVSLGGLGLERVCSHHEVLSFQPDEHQAATCRIGEPFRVLQLFLCWSWGVGTQMGHLHMVAKGQQV